MMPSSTQNRIIIQHEGKLDFETIGVLIGKLQGIMQELNTKVYVYKKVLSVMIESLENIYKYYIDIDEASLPKDVKPTFQLIKQEELFIVSVSNPVKNIDLDRLVQKLEDINMLDKEGLKNLYKDTITNGQFTSKGGAGLGFIEMAKISGRPLEYRFESLNDSYSNYFLTIKI